MADQPGCLPSTSVTRPLVGREREQAILHAALAAALAGHGSLVLIGGEAGIGKTTLAEALLTEAQAQGALVLVGRCYDLSETPPYGPWAEALARAPGGDDLPSPPDLAGGGGATSQAALFAATHAYLGAMGVRQPLVVLLDDLQWADTASLDLLRVLGRQLADVPLLLLVTYRADELTRRHPLARLLPLLVREARATRVAVRPLREADLRALAGRYALPPADGDRLAAYLHSRAEGNPLFAGELLRTLEEDGALLRRAGDGWALGPIAASGVPPLLRQVIDARVDRLGEAARELLTVAAVVAQVVPLALWQAVAGADEDALLATVERAVGAGLLTEMPDGDSARFAHALVREALYDGLPTARRRALHRRVADTLGAAPAPDPDAVADHLRRAADPRAAAWLERAGERAQRAYAWRTAAARFTDALGIGDARGAARGWRLVRLARLLRHDDPRRGLAYLDEALHLVPATDDPVLAAAARLQRGLLRCHGGDWRGGLAETAAGAAALDALPAAEVAALRARQGCLGVVLDPALRGTLALGLAGVGRYAEARALATRMVAVPSPPAAEGALDDDPHADAWWALGMAHGALRDPAAAQAAYATAGARYRAMGHHWAVTALAGSALAYLALPYRPHDLTGRRRDASAVAAAHERFAGVGQVLPPTAALALLGFVEGDWTGALDAWTTGRAASHGGPTRHPYQYAPVAIGRIARARGDATAARAAVAGLLAGPGDEPGDLSLYLGLGVQALAANLALDAGDRDEARDWLAAHDRWLAWSGAVLWRAEGQLGWAAYHRAGGDAAQARQHAEAARAHALEPRQPLALLAAHRLLGELDTAASRFAAARAHLDAALALAEACAAPYERALTLLALADLHAATGHRAEVATALDGAVALLAPLDARPALARAESLAARLAATATPLCAAMPADADGLTAREAAVLRLVALGLTNREVAARLAISPRTVGTHLTAIHGKLGVTTRTAAAHEGRRRGLA